MRQYKRLINFKYLAGVALALGLTSLLGQAAPPSPPTKQVVDEAPLKLPPERATGQVMYMIGSTLMKDYTTALMARLVEKAHLPPAVIVNQGSTRGIQEFCSGTGLNTPDIVAVSRQIRTSEIDNCRDHGVNDIVEILVGYDAAGIVSRQDDQNYPLTLNSLYRAIAAELAVDMNDFVPNNYSRWNEVDPKLPNTEIRFVIPVPSLGGRSFFEDWMLQGACRKIPEIKVIFEPDKRIKQCVTLRKDGRIIEHDIPFDVNVVKTFAKSPLGTLSVMPLRFATTHKESIKVQPLEGVVPSGETIADHSYQFTRNLYYLIKKAHVKDYYQRGLVSGLREFITELTRESTIGPNGYLVKMGVLPMEEKNRAEVREASLRLNTIER